MRRRSWALTGCTPQEDRLREAGEELLVSDVRNHRVCAHALDGTFLREFGSQGAGDGQFHNPYSIAVAGELAYVADYGNHRVQVLR